MAAAALGALMLGTQLIQQREARVEKMKMRAEGRRIEQEAKKREQTEEARAGVTEQTQQKFKRQRALAAEKQGRAGTILGGAPTGGAEATTSLGGGPGKTLLGA